MTVNEIGQLFLVGFEGTALSHEVRKFLLELKPSGVILFSRNIENPLQVASLNRDLQLFALEHWNQGLLIGIDQEGGRVRRLYSPFVSCPSAQNLAGGTAARELVASYMTVVSYEMRLVGFNTNFVPVLDVVTPSTEDSTSVIGDRSFGGDPKLVSKLGRVVIDAVRSMGIITCGKHFPGHGGTKVDSHLDLPVDTRDKEVIWKRDVPPFRMAIEKGIDMLMTAHVVYPSLDPLYPATLSQTVVNQLLRSDINYDGVVITDDLDMGAITNHFDAASCAEMALKAGVDLLLFSKSVENVLVSRDAILHGLETASIPVDVIERALSRIKRLKDRYDYVSMPAPPETIRDHFGL